MGMLAKVLRWAVDEGWSVGELASKIRELGYPDEVAMRIAKGDLPMDEASVAKRIQEQNYGDPSEKESPHT